MLQTDRHIQRPVSPPWKVRTRPCPFYSSGRCLFSASCNFRHVVKSPLTPIERPLSFQHPKEEYVEPYDVLEDGEYDDNDATLNWSKEIASNLPVAGNHSREPSAASYTNTVSSTETGTVRGHAHYVGQGEFNDDTIVNDQPDVAVYGLGLTNLHEVRQDHSQDFGLASQQARTTLRVRPRPAPLYVTDDPPATPFMFPNRLQSAQEETVQQYHRRSSRASSYAQEVEVASNGHMGINLETPGASSLLTNRRKATVSEWSAQVHNREPPQFDPPGSPTITLKSLGKNTRSVDETGMLVASPSPQLLETPPIDYDLESPSRARQRFHNAFKLVTNELKMRQRLMRKSPTTPDAPSTSANGPTSQMGKRDSIRHVATNSSDKDVSFARQTTAGPSSDIQEQQDTNAGPRSWLKPFRLSTLGSPALPLTSSNPPAPSARRPSEDSKPVTRSSSPSKRSATPGSSRKVPSLGKQNSVEGFSFSSALESPFVDGSAFPPVPPSFVSPVNSRPGTSRNGSVHYIHSPSPTKWVPPSQDPTPRKGSCTASPRGASPIRSKRMSPRSHSSHSSRVVISTPPPLPTTQPKLFFAIASNQPDEVAKLLADGTASPNETVGPQEMHALAFAVENASNGDPANMPKLQEIVTTLLSYGAALSPSDQLQAQVDPLLSHFLDKASRSPIPNASSSNVVDLEIPLKRAKFIVVGQESGLMEFARAYAAHIRLAQYLSEEGDGELPFVALLAGPSGHGKTLLASKVGSLLAVPSYTINMTLIKGQRDLWSSSSCNKKEAATHRTLVDFLSANNGQPAVVVIDEIEKLDNLSLLQSLLVPWETGRLQVDGTSSNFIDASKTVWLCTSNIASQEIIHMVRQDSPPSFDAIVKQTRSCLRDALGASLVARVSTTIPFLPFSWEERLAISSKCLTALQRNVALSDPSALSGVPPGGWKGVIETAAGDYLEAEGARSIRRTILRLTDEVLHGAST